MKVLLSRRALQDLASIRRYTRDQFGPLQEERYLSGLERHLENLARFPNLGRPLGAGTNRRVSTYEKHLVLYAIESDCLVIARVIHSAQQAEFDKARQALEKRGGAQASR